MVASLLHVYLDTPVWTDGSLISDDLAGIAAARAGVFCSCFCSCFWFRRWWRHLDLLPYDPELGVERCSSYFSLPGLLKTVQRAEMWEVILALQALAPVHLGVNSTKVVRQCLSYSFGCLTGAPPGAVS